MIAHFAGSLHHGMVYGHYYLAREWVRMGHSVTIVAASWVHMRHRQPEFSGRLTEQWIDGIRYIWLKVPDYAAGGRFGRVMNLMSFAAQVWALPLPLNKPDLVICSSHCPFAIHGSERIARRTGARLVFEVRDLWPLTLLELGGASRRNPLIQAMQWSEDFAYRYADRVVSVLSASIGYMVSRGMAPEKFAYIPNGADVGDVTNLGSNDPTPLTASQRQIQSIRKKDRFVVGFCGRLTSAYALDSLLKSLAQPNMDDVHVVLVGGGHLLGELQALASSLGVKDRVTFLGVVDKSEVAAVLSQMDVLYLGLSNSPLYRFGVSPTKLNDYLLAAKPVLYAVKAPDDVIKQSGCGITCEPEDVAAIADAIQRFRALSATERVEMGRRGHDWLLSNRAYPKLAQEFLKVAFS